MKKLREQYPLVFALVATALVVACFYLFPSSDPRAGFVDAGMLRQNVAAAVVMAFLYVFSGECLFSDSDVPSRAWHKVPSMVLVMLSAALIGAAKVFVQNSVITPPTTAVLLFVAVLVATALFEEILFRGFIFEAFAKTLRSQGRRNALPVAAVVSSLLFGILHISSDVGSLFRLTAYVQAVVKVAEGTLFGLVMCALCASGRSVWVPVAIHAAFDIVSELPIYLSTGVQTSTYITGSPSDILVLALGTAVLVPPAMWSWNYLHQGNGEPL